MLTVQKLMPRISAASKFKKKLGPSSYIFDVPAIQGLGDTP
jgi:hypothetical protein